MRVVVDECCSGCDLCASICPDAFDMGDGGKAVPRHKNVPAWLEHEYEMGAKYCPDKAIKIYCQV